MVHCQHSFTDGVRVFVPLRIPPTRAFIQEELALNLELNGKRALVLASSSVLGLAVASELAREGAVVSLCSRSQERAAEAARQTSDETGGITHAFEVDVSDRASLERLFERATQAMGGLDILVCNAGGPPPGDFLSLDEDKWNTAYQLTLMSVV